MSPAGSRFVPASPSYKVVRKENPLEDTLPRMKWRDRMRTDFLLAKPPYQAKTFSQAVSSIWSLFRRIPDTINPWYLREGDTLYARGVENLVLAVRGLSSPNNKGAHQAMRRIPLFASIVQVLRDWDVESINRELGLLQRDPYDRSFADFAPLLKVLVRPLYLLSRLHTNVHILPAITKMFEFARANAVARDERETLQRYFQIAREEMPNVFEGLRQRLYPIFLKLFSSQFQEPDELYTNQLEPILAFLGIQDHELLRDMPEVHPEAAVASPSAASETAHAESARASEPSAASKMARQGLQLLDRFFPRAGWKTLAERPDLYAYFQPIFDLGKGADLVPIDDAIQVILPLSEILQQLFFGFQNMQWGTRKNAQGEVVRLQEEVDKSIARWHFFNEEFFGKNYLPLLQEYCREVERAGVVATDAKRREHQLLWLKRNYLLPHLILPVMDDIRVKSLGYPNLAIQVRELLDLLAPVALDVEQRAGKGTTALTNPDVKARFPVDNVVSQRFHSALRKTALTDKGDQKIIEQGSNRALLFCTLALLSVLDDLLSRPSSLFYRSQPPALYRTSGIAGDPKPVYNAPRKNTLTLLKKLNDQVPPAQAEALLSPAILKDLYSPFLTVEELRKRIAEAHSSKKPFVYLELRELDAQAQGHFQSLLPNLASGENEWRPQDDGSWVCLLRNAIEEEAEDLARSVLQTAADHQPPLPLGILVLPYSTTWSQEKLLSFPAKGWEASRDIPAQILGIFSAASQSFEFRTNVPTVRPLTADDLGAASPKIDL